MDSKKFSTTRKLSEKFGVSFPNLRWRFCKRKEWDFLTRVGGGGGTRTPLDPLDTDSPILACSRLSDRVEGAKRYEQKKKTSEAFIISLPLFFSSVLLLYGYVTAPLYQVSGSLASFKLAVSLRPV